MAAVSRAESVWEGPLTSGKGTVGAGSSGLFNDLGVTWAARTERHGGNTSPEELLAAAHAACFNMALSARLANAGSPAERLQTTSEVTFDNPEGKGWKISTSRLQVRGRVPGMDQGKFQELAEDAKNNCPVSQALKGNVDLSVTATLEG